MQRKLENPLSMQDLERINHVLQQLAEGRELSRRASACGWDCTAQDAMMQSYEARFQAVKQQFFTGRDE